MQAMRRTVVQLSSRLRELRARQERRRRPAVSGFCPRRIQPQGDGFEVAHQGLRQRIGIPVKTRADAVVHGDMQPRLLTDGLEAIDRVDQIEMSATDANMVIKRTRREGVGPKTVGPPDRTGLGPLGGHLLEADAFAHFHMPHQLCASAFGAAEVRQGHTDAVNPALRHLFGPDGRRVEQLIPHSIGRRLNQYCMLHPTEVIWQGPRSFDGGHHYRQHGNHRHWPPGPAPGPAGPAGQGHGDRAQPPQYRKQGQHEDGADQALELDHQGHQHQQRCRCHARDCMSDEALRLPTVAQPRGQCPYRERTEVNKAARHGVERHQSVSLRRAAEDQPQQQAQRHAARQRPEAAEGKQGPTRSGRGHRISSASGACVSAVAAAVKRGARRSHTQPSRARPQSIHQPGSHSPERQPRRALAGSAWWLLCQHSPMVSSEIPARLRPCTATAGRRTGWLPWLCAK
mmetsp:Transcript_15314/g.36485  ORF Transcript_15314/g.36485 Transcript_15314/m.36485 type:complete len:457 (-) Transcript_15314:1031-2401(-)